MRRVRPRRHDGPQCGEALRLTCGFPLKRRLEAGPGGGLASCCPEITPFMGRARSPKSHTMRLRLTGRLGRRDGREAQLTGRPTGRPFLFHRQLSSSAAGAQRRSPNSDTQMATLCWPLNSSATTTAMPCSVHCGRNKFLRWCGEFSQPSAAMRAGMNGPDPA